MPPASHLLFSHEGIDLAYRESGAGDPVILVHGFGSTKETNWEITGWTETLNRAGYRTVAFDHRGHGASSKPHDPALYGDRTMSGDVLGLMDHLGIERALLMGYSMGAYISVTCLERAPERFAGCVLGGIGHKSLAGGTAHSARIVAALEAEKASDIDDALAKPYRVFADRQKADRVALAACMRFQRPPFTDRGLEKIAVPVLVATGTDDGGMGDPSAFAALFAQGESVDIPGRDHMRATGDPVFKEAVLAFFERFRATI